MIKLLFRITIRKMLGTYINRRIPQLLLDQQACMYYLHTVPPDTLLWARANVGLRLIDMKLKMLESLLAK